VTSTDPRRTYEPATAAPERGAGGRDPWGVKRAENLLTSLQGVLSARVVVSEMGEVQEIHVLTQGGTPPKQVVRNVESALLAHLGLKIDHRKISVAQTADVRPIEALEQSAVKEEARKRGILFSGMELQTSRNQKVVVKVTFQVGEEEVEGSEEGADNPKTRPLVAAKAAVKALGKDFEGATLEVEGVKMVTAFEREFAFVGVLLVQRRVTHLLTGTCEIADSPEQAAILAVLNATNRWLASRF